MTKCKINNGAIIEVELTELGRDMYREVYGATGREYSVPLKMQLWEFMNVFGDSFYNGGPHIVEKNIIIVEGDVDYDE